MKRKTIDAICRKVGMKVAADDDPRYSEPLSIIFSPTPRPASSAPTAAARSFTPTSENGELPAENPLELYTCYAADDSQRFRSIKRRSLGPWSFLASGEWSQSPFHQGTNKFYVRSSKDKDYWALLSVGFPSKIIAVAHTRKDDSIELVGARMLQASQLAGGDYIDMLEDHGDFDVDRFWALYASS